MITEHDEISILLSPQEAQLKHLVFYRVRLHSSTNITTSFMSNKNEGVLYPLTGSARFKASWGTKAFTGIVQSGRSKVFENRPKGFQALRIPGDMSWNVELQTFDTFDALYIETEDDLVNWGKDISPQPEICYDWNRQLVGDESEQMQRRVWHLEKPNGFFLDVGETHNLPGQWSSIPAHATDKDIENVIDGRRTWEEVFFCLIEPERALIPKGMGFAMMRMDGVFYDGKHVNESRLIHNGDALVTPLGSHPIVVAPNHRLWYFWGYYGNALAKTYNVWADDVGTYVK